MHESVGLRRNIGLPLLTCYGLGTILGAGVYVLIGEVVGLAGMAAPTAFVLAAVLAGVTAFSFAELGSRIPKSAGEAAYSLAAFHRRWLAGAVGWAVVTVGTVSAATMIRGFTGYLGVFASAPDIIVIIACVAVLATVACWGIGESMIAAAAITVIEVAGLLFVCIIAGDSLARVHEEWINLLPRADSVSLIGIVSGAFIAFYAFIGFEDIVNIAEEVRHPERNIPRAIILSLAISTALYAMVAIIAVLAIPAGQLAGNEAPLAAIVESRGIPPEIIAAISLLAVINGALVQIVMASRVLYGLAGDGLAYQSFGRVSRITQTPIYGTLTIAVIILILSLSLSLADLARITSFVSLSIFAVVNLSLLRLKRATPDNPAFAVSATVPATGAILCLAMIAYEGIRFLK